MLRTDLACGLCQHETLAAITVVPLWGRRDRVERWGLRCRGSGGPSQQLRREPQITWVHIDPYGPVPSTPAPPAQSLSQLDTWGLMDFLQDSVRESLSVSVSFPRFSPCVLGLCHSGALSFPFCPLIFFASLCRSFIVAGSPSPSLPPLLTLSASF